MNLSRLIKYIREELKLSQEEFAERVGVDRMAVTRWENDKTNPNKIAQIRLYEIAKENSIDLFARIIKDLPEPKTAIQFGSPYGTPILWIQPKGRCWST